MSVASALDGFANGFRARRTMEDDKADRELRKKELDAGVAAPRSARSFDTGDSGVAPSGDAAPSVAIPTGERAAYIRDGLINRGMPEHIADGFLMNFQDESRLVADIVEGADNVHGTRGRGLYQLTDTKPGVGRRSEYERWVKANGAKAYDIDSQLDFMMHELQGSEKGAWAKIQGAKTSGEAGAAIVKYFLRPAAKHRDSRMAKYLGQKMPARSVTAEEAAAITAKPLPAPAAPATVEPAALARSVAGRSFSINPGAVAPWQSFQKYTVTG